MFASLHPPYSPRAAFRRHLEGGARGGTDNVPRWSAGRRSVSVAGLRTPLDHRTRAPRDGIRNPVRMGFATPSRQGAWAFPNEGGAREASQPSHGGLANPRRLPALHSLVEGDGNRDKAAPRPQTTGRRSVGFVIPGRAKREPGIHNPETTD